MPGILLPCQIKAWVLLEAKCTVGYNMAAFHFKGAFGELKHEPKNVEMETSVRIFALVLSRKVINR